MTKGYRKRKKIYEVYNKNLHLVMNVLGQSIFEIVDNKPTKTQDGYICPLCIELFSKKDLDNNRPNPLTIEHIEPNAIGGKQVVLTCKKCNNQAGDLIDNALKIHTNINADNIANAKFMIDEFKLKGKFKFDLKKNEVHNILNKNNDYVESKIQEFFNSPGSKNVKFSFSFENKKKLTCGLLKVAHLKMFSLFGYGYLMNKSIYRLCKVIKNPNDELVNSMHFIKLPDSLPKEESIFFGEINDLKFFLVAITLKGKSKNLRYGFFIPGPDEDDIGLYQEIKKVNEQKFDIAGIDFNNNLLENPYSYFNFFRNKKNEYCHQKSV